MTQTRLSLILSQRNFSILEARDQKGTDYEEKSRCCSAFRAAGTFTAHYPGPHFDIHGTKHSLIQEELSQGHSKPLLQLALARIDFQPRRLARSDQTSPCQYRHLSLKLTSRSGHQHVPGTALVPSHGPFQSHSQRLANTSDIILLWQWQSSAAADSAGKHVNAGLSRSSPKSQAKCAVCTL